MLPACPSSSLTAPTVESVPLSSLGLRYMRARLCARRGRWVEASGHYAALADSCDARRALMVLGVSAHELLLELSFSLLRAGELDDAAAAAQLPPNASRTQLRTAALYRAEAVLRLGRPAECLELFKLLKPAEDADAPVATAHILKGADAGALFVAEANLRAVALSALGRWAEAAEALAPISGPPGGGGEEERGASDTLSAVNRALIKLHCGKPADAAHSWQAFRARGGGAVDSQHGLGDAPSLARACAALDRLALLRQSQ